MALYAVVMFVWTPLHYLHLLAITLASTTGAAVIGSRLPGSSAVAASAAA